MPANSGSNRKSTIENSVPSSDGTKPTNEERVVRLQRVVVEEEAPVRLHEAANLAARTTCPAGAIEKPLSSMVSLGASFARLAASSSSSSCLRSAMRAACSMSSSRAASAGDGPARRCRRRRGAAAASGAAAGAAGAPAGGVGAATGAGAAGGADWARAAAETLSATKKTACLV